MIEYLIGMIVGMLNMYILMKKINGQYKITTAPSGRDRENER